MLVNFLHRHATSEHSCHCQVSSMTRIASCHHVLCIEHLLCQFRYGQRTVLLGATRCERCEPRHEEVESRKWYHVDGEFAKVGVQLSRETETSCNSAHGGGYQVVEIAICGCSQLQGAEADIIQGFVVNAECLVGILDQLMHRQRRIIRLHDGVGHFR